MSPSDTNRGLWPAGLWEHRVAFGIAATASILLAVILVAQPGKRNTHHGPTEPQATASDIPPNAHPADSAPRFTIPQQPATIEQHAQPANTQRARSASPKPLAKPTVAKAPKPAAQTATQHKAPATNDKTPPPSTRPVVTPVKVQPAEKPAPTVKSIEQTEPPTGRHVFFVQVAAYRDHGSAQKYAATLLQKGWNSVVIANAQGFFTVRVGPVSSRDAAEKLRQRLQSKARLQGFIVQG